MEVFEIWEMTFYCAKEIIRIIEAIYTVL